MSDSQAILDSIRQIVHALELGSRAAQKAVGLSSAQLFVLQTLAAEALPVSINELAARTHTHQSSVSVVVSRLADAKLVRRVRSAQDARRTELTVTAAGRRILDTGVVTPQQRLLNAVSDLPVESRAQLRRLLANVVAHSGMDAAEAPPMFLERAKTPRRASRRLSSQS